MDVISSLESSIKVFSVLGKAAFERLRGLRAKLWEPQKSFDTETSHQCQVQDAGITMSRGK